MSARARSSVRLFVVLSMAVFGLAVVGPAAAAGGATVTGKVTAPGGFALSGVRVTAFTLDDIEGWQPVLEELTEPNGTWAFTDLEPDTYRFGFSTTTNPVYLTEYWDDEQWVDTAADVAVEGGDEVNDLDAELTPSAHITGTVTAPGGAGIKDVDVLVYMFTDYWQGVGFASTTPDGTYNVSHLPAGEYRVRFEGSAAGYGDEYWDDAQLLEDADDIVVGTGATGTADAELAPNHSISGTVTNSAAQPLDQIKVRAYEFDDLADQWTSVAEAFTDPDGLYTIPNREAGTYRIGFDDSSQVYFDEFFDDAPSVDHADDVVMAAADLTGKNAVLTEGSHITGVVTDAADDPIEGISVAADRLVAGVWESHSSTSTAPDGAYDLAGLPAGDYRVSFVPASDYVPEWWNNQPTAETATPISVAATAAVSGKDAVLATGAHILGTVRSEADVPLSGVHVDVEKLVGGDWQPVTGASTDSSGEYDVDQLAAGTYRAHFDDGSGGYSEEWWNDAPTLALADDIVVAAGATADADAELWLWATPVTNNGAPTITGSPKVGLTLTANPGSWSPSAVVSHTYQWLSNGAVISGATTSRYAVPPAQLGKRLSVRVTGSRPGWPSVQATSASTAKVMAGTIKSRRKPNLQGKPRVGKILFCTSGPWDPGNVKLRYAWLLNGKVISGAKAHSIEPKPSFLGKKVSCKVTASLNGYATLALTTASKKVKAP